VLKSGLVDARIVAISVITRTGYNEQIRLDLGARYTISTVKKNFPGTVFKLP